ncbi:hypothetical protein S7335_3122 [Synechococcus sp. PCC 7335]|uniref:DUF3769 domain-containing protein n=1 Tax=Synechococcus sp. (strain ATCC 29403 / PCC 7335) TaxID=91464 RepID=UPI00017ED95C|nr:DUF3769 domain-containing protein [Synechococcus sp. PCC 7335]EDX85421.1 hypothetical protein S7335_3122 [Synechococcus sp. PCC 7335]
MVQINLPPQPVAVIEAIAEQAQRPQNFLQHHTQLVEVTSSRPQPRLSMLVDGLEQQGKGIKQTNSFSPVENTASTSLAQTTHTEIPGVGSSPIDVPSPVDTKLEENLETEEDLAPEAIFLEPNETEASEQPSDEEFISRLSLTADSQTYDPETQVITARGDVRLQVGDSVIEADQAWVNLTNRFTLAEGNVLLTTGGQLARGNSAEYNFIQQAGVIRGAVGTLFLPDIEEDFASPLAGGSRSRRVFDPVNRNPSLEVVNDGNVQIGVQVGSRSFNQQAPRGSDGQFSQLRFETDELSFGVEGWRAESVRITNDPFSPPEVELRADSLLLRNLSATQDELLLKRPRLVFDQGLALPLLRSRILINRGDVDSDDINPVPVAIGIDERDRGGLYIGRQIPIVTTPRTRLSITPQYFAAQALSGDTNSPIDLENFGTTARLDNRLSPTTRLSSRAEVNGFDFEDITEDIRASVSVDQALSRHRLSLQYSYRERLFNGSLGFQDVQSSVGTILLSPTFTLGKTGLKLSYQASAQLINARTDQQDLLLASGSDTGRVTLGRYQGSVALTRSFNLLRGKPKPATQEEGLRFTPRPVVPYLNLNTGIRTTLTHYSSGDSQNSLLANIGLDAQLGHFSRNFGDYTRLSLGYSQSFIGEASSPFLFDRLVDRNVLSVGVAQQLYGPIIAGFETAFSVDSGDSVSTAYSLEYSRRTYGILVRYNATQSVGSIGLRLSNFNWVGETDPFDTPRIRQVEAGVVERF